MIIRDPLNHLGRLLRGAGRLPDDVLSDLGDLEADVRKLGSTAENQRQAYRLVQRVEAHLEGRQGVVWPVPADTDPPTVQPGWSSAPPPA